MWPYDQPGKTLALTESRWIRWGLPSCLFLVAVAVRALPIQAVYLRGQTHFFGNDAYYHMRRIFYSLANFPSVLEFDPYINYPNGGQPIWSGFFDWILAALLWPFRDILTDSQIEMVVVWIPPVMGGATVVILFWLARRFFGAQVAAIAATCLCFLSAHFWYSQIGFVDHHVAVALITTGLLAAGMIFIAAAEDLNKPLSGHPFVGLAAIRAHLASTLVLGSLLALSLLVWPGALLHVGLIEVGLLVCLLSRPTREQATVVAGRMVIVHVVALAMIAPFSIGREWAQWSAFSPVVLSRFQPWFFASAALFCAICAGLWTRFPHTGPGLATRAASAAIVASGLLGISFLSWPELFDGALEAWGWLAKADHFQALVSESSSLFEVGGHFGLQVATLRLSWFVLAIPVALVAGVVWLRKVEQPGALALYLWWTFGLCVVTVIQKRFFNSASVSISLLFALSVVAIYHFISRRWIETAMQRVIVLAWLATLSVWVYLPTLKAYQLHVENLWNLVAGDPDKTPQAISYVGMQRLALREAASWLRGNSPSPGPWLDASVSPDYSVLAPWGLGHVIEYLARRPTVNNNFGDDVGKENFMLVTDYFSANESQGVDILEQLGVRYIITQPNVGFLTKPPPVDGLFTSLSGYDGSEFTVFRGQQADYQGPVMALRHHRLIFESIHSLQEGKRQAYYKVFEYVKGAVIVGQAAPGTTVKLELEIKTNRNRLLTYASRALVSADGHYELRVPYSNYPVEGGIGPATSYRLSCRGEHATVSVSERAIRRGERVAGPEICL
jgi:dolichyl-diphosphooligosaccharide--protein glycosyltransferase